MSGRLAAQAEVSPEAHMEEVAATHPTVAALMKEALTAYRAGAFDRALAAVNNALTQAPQQAALFAAKGELLVRMGRLPDAEAAYREAVQRAPHGLSDGLSYRLAVLAYLQSKRPEAALILTQLLAHQPDHAAAAALLGTIYLEQQDPKHALPLLEKASQTLTDRADLQFNLGLAYEQLGRTAESLACYRRALSLRPGLTAAQAGILRLETAAGAPAP